MTAGASVHAVPDMPWSEFMIARVIGRHVLNSRCLLLVDRCKWTGNECDVLGVTKDLRIIDVEIKITRADFKADAAKDKWWHRQRWGEPGEPLTHPVKVWKHYFAMPAEIWTDDLASFLPSLTCGVILLHRAGSGIFPRVRRRAVPSKTAQRLTPAQVMDIARLANLRMWDAYERRESADD